MNENNFFNISQQFEDYQRFKEQAKQNISNQNITNKFDGLKKMYQTSQTATDPQTKQNSDTIVRLWEVAMKGREYAQKQWKDWSAANDERVINTLSDSLPNFKANLDNYMMDTGMDATGFAINMWWQQPEMEEEKSSDTLSQLWVVWAYWLWGVWTLWGLTEAVDRIARPYDWSFSIKEDEAKSIQRDNVDKIKMDTYDTMEREALEELKAAEAAWDKKAIETANKKLKAAIEWHDKAFESSKTPTRKTVETAENYNLWWLNKANIWDKAKAEWELLFEQEIVPALKNSKQTVNVQELIDSIDVKDLAKWDPDKLSAYTDALEDLKNSFSDPKYAEYSMMDTQTLKSGIQGRTPQKFYKWKEITNELQELKWILGSKLKNELHNNLSAEMWENTAIKYLDYSNLMDIANAGVKDRAQSLSKQGFGGFQNWVKDKLVTPLSSWPWLLIRKTRKFFESIPSKVSDTWKNILKEIEKNPKALLNKWLKWVKELLKLDAFMFAPDFREVADEVQYEVGLDLIKQRLNWKWVFKWKSEEEMEELLPMQAIMDTLQDEEFMQYLYKKWIDIEKLEKQLTNISE